VIERYRRSSYLSTLVLFLVVTWIIYAPGLRGGFLFDDFANLPALGVDGPINSWPAFWRYITSGMADPLGRPLAMLSFLLDAHDWPADPFPFKRSNLILHLLNGVLLAQLLKRLGRILAAENNSVKAGSALRFDLAAVLGAGVWLMHPLMVSTTLYTVQREAMLSATFVLLGLLAWLRGREAMRAGHRINGLSWMLLGLAGFTLMAMLSKANGMLLPAFAVVLDQTVTPFNRAPAAGTLQIKNRRTYRLAMVCLGWLPMALVAAYLVYQGWNGVANGISSLRPWTLGQRLLTEPRVLMDYLKLLWLPRPFTPGLFNDQIHASNSLWSPLTTLPALLAVVALISSSWIYRHRYPTWALAILFYFVGQSLESSSIPLELYFEHRNYLTAMPMFWPLALWICGASPITASSAVASTREKKTAPSQTVFKGSSSAAAAPANWKPQRKRNGTWAIFKPVLGTALVLGLGIMTYARTSLWGNTRAQTQLWAALNPESPRAQADIANDEINSGHPSLAVARLEPALARAPDQAQLAMNLFNAQCQLGKITPALLSNFRKALRTTRDVGPLLVNWFSNKMDQIGKPDCPGLSFNMLATLLDAATANPNLNSVYGRRQDMDYLRGRMALMQGDADTALFEFNQALNEDAQISMALQQAALLGSKGYPRQGLAHLDHFELVRKHVEAVGMGMAWVHAWVLQNQHYWPNELAHLRDTLSKDAAHQANSVNDPSKAQENFGIR
jgi:tetratricopeptide (TPR) repeat protein